MFAAALHIFATIGQYRVRDNEYGRSMFWRQKYEFSPTPGERGLAVAYLMIALFGTVLAFTVVNRLEGGSAIIRPMGLYDYWIILSGAVGAFGGLYIGCVWLGHPGLSGWWKAVVSVPVISLVAALIAGTLALPGHGTMFGPLGLLTTFIAHPLLALFWAATIFAAHFRFILWRKERDSIFAVAATQ